MGCVPTRVRERIRQVTLRKSEYIPLNPVFGVPLINVVCSEKFPYVAKIVVDCAEFIERDENIAQNVYSTTSRLPYDQKKVSQLREMVRYVDSTGCDMNFMWTSFRFTWTVTMMRSNRRRFT